MEDSTNKIQKILDRSVDNENIFGTVVCVSRDSECRAYAAGNLSCQSRYFIASVTKLYITAIILRLRTTHLIRLDDSISKYLPPDTMQGLHVYKGVDYSDQISVRHLLSHTSGLPDYFMQRRNDGKSLIKELISGNDQKWTFDEAVRVSKTMRPGFKPGQKGKAFYSDTNFQLLGKIIEVITEKDLSDVLHEHIFMPLELKQTYLYQDSYDTLPVEMYYKNNHARIPLAMCSFWADGGIVSTADESMIFLEAFLNGKLFPVKYIEEIKDWKRIFFPFQYGVGIARFKLPWFFSPFKPIPELIGHMGTSGAFAYYCPQKDVYITGTINQVHNPGLPYRLIINILNTIPEKASQYQ